MPGKVMQTTIPRILIAGTQSGVGKTTIATGIMATLAGQGLKVQGYKVGPDYIDPGYHTAVTGRPSRNLDTWMLAQDTVTELFVRSAVGMDVAVIEGVMGLYDGFNGVGDDGSTAQLAKWLHAPVILVVDVRSQARSAAAVVKGFQAMDPDVNIAGVILNRVGSSRHEAMVKEAIEYYCGVPVVGILGRHQELAWKERHLGLVPLTEKHSNWGQLEEWGNRVEQGIDLPILMKLAHLAPPLALPAVRLFASENKGKRKIPIGVAKDEAFHFYYQDGMELLEHIGAEFVYFSPLRDRALPSGIGGVILGGGFPELFLPTLAENHSMMDSIREAYGLGMPIYGECGGLMYLTQAIETEEASYPMVGLVPGYCRMEKRLVGMGYVEATAIRDNLLSPAGETLRGHQFHYSNHHFSADTQGIFQFRRRQGRGMLQGFGEGNLLASYLHFHWASQPQAAQRFLNRCRDYLAGAIGKDREGALL